MIPGSPAVKNQPDWRQQLAAAIRDPQTLLEHLGLQPESMPPTPPGPGFALKVPHSYVERIEYGNAADPLLRQIWPDAAETLAAPGYSADPLQESRFSPVPGLVHKYRSRALLIASASCAVHCRYCFRSHFPYAEHLQHPLRIAPILDYLRAHPAIEEIILSGGDPLSLSEERLDLLLRGLGSIDSLRTLRIHTRLPVVLPSRVDAALLDCLGRTRLRPVMVLHINHPQEIDAALAAACGRLTRGGIVVFNQSVLLAGVNDSAATLAALSEKLFDCGVLPYYLHLLDPVAGSARFQLDLARAMAIYAELEALLAGYLLPRLVREIPGAPHKVQAGSPRFHHPMTEFRA